jgi:hypothetical protein
MALLVAGSAPFLQWYRRVDSVPDRRVKKKSGAADEGPASVADRVGLCIGRITTLGTNSAMLT